MKLTELFALAEGWGHLDIPIYVVDDDGKDIELTYLYCTMDGVRLGMVPPMTFDGYMERVYLTHRQHVTDPDPWRFGQTCFNVLHDVRPDLSPKVRGNHDLDPFYVDHKLPAFFEFLKENW